MIRTFAKKGEVEKTYPRSFPTEVARCAVAVSRLRSVATTIYSTCEDSSASPGSCLSYLVSAPIIDFLCVSAPNFSKGVTVAFGQRRPSMMSTLVNITRPANGGLPANGSPASPVKRTAHKSCANRSVELVQLIQVALESPRHQVLLTPEHVHATSTSTPSLDVV